jgi:hypothetical protein
MFVPVRIQEVSGFNLSPEAEYPDKRILRVFLPFGFFEVTGHQI